MSVHQCSQMATPSLHVIYTGRHVLLVTNVGYLLIFTREDGFSTSLNLREEKALILILPSPVSPPLLPARNL